jgi:segregation and condensation protein B
MDREQLKRVLEALIFASASPLTLQQMVAILGEIEQTEIESALTELSSDLSNRAIYLKKTGGGYQFGTRAEYAEWIGQMFQEKQNSRLSRAALETLAIIAFKQPISRVEVAAIRGVNSDGVMKKLLDFRLITISGRDTGPGRPLLFKTTSEFLNYFGINDVSELPRPKEVEELLADGEGGEILQQIPDEVLIAEGLSDNTEEEMNDESAEGEESQETFEDDAEDNDADSTHEETDDGEIDDFTEDSEDDSESATEQVDGVDIQHEDADEFEKDEKEE